MQKILLLFLLTTSFDLIAQNVKKETTFLIKERYGEVCHSVFIEPNRNSKFYNHISDYSFGKFDQQSYDESLDYLKKHNLHLTKVLVNELPKKWIYLHQYKSKFYVYYPSDFYAHYKIRITNKSYEDFSGEGPSANKILGFKKIDDNTFQFNLAGLYSNGRKVLIHLIDKKAGIAVFEETSNDREKVYYLMVDAAKIRNFPLIVNYCENQKQPEFEFDKTNFIKLIDQKR